MDHAVSFRGALEVLDRSGHVQQRVRVEQLPFRVGRALDNDLVLDDPYVCAHHAEIRGEEKLELVDCGSLNGSFQGAVRERRGRIELAHATDLRVGHTLLRYRAVEEALPATLADPMAGSRWLGLDRLRWAMAALSGCAAVVIGEQVIGSTQTVRLGVIVSSAAPALIVLALWALSWSLVNRVVAHRFHYAGHLAIGSFGVIAVSFAESLGSYMSFAFAGDKALSGFSNLVNAALLSALVFGHLRLISRGSARRLLLPAGLVGVAFLSLAMLPSASDNQFRSEPEMSTSLKAPFAALRAGRDSQAYYSDATEALDAADAEAADAAD